MAGLNSQAFSIGTTPFLSNTKGAFCHLFSLSPENCSLQLSTLLARTMKNFSLYHSFLFLLDTAVVEVLLDHHPLTTLNTDS